MSAVPDEVARRIAELIDGAQSALFVTGAGISADSGLPTYRGVGGLYNSGGTEDGIPIELALSGHMMNTRPELCWKYIAQVEEAGRGAEPNEGHRVIARLQERIARTWVLTQNVDGLHREAGSSRIIDIHGDVRQLRCTRCDWTDTVESYADLGIPPDCPECNGLVRPDVVLFGEMLPPAKVASMLRELETGFDLVFSIGTTSVFPYIAEPVLRASARGLPTVEINPAETEVSDHVSIAVRAGAAAAMAAIERALQ